MKRAAFRERKASLEEQVLCALSYSPSPLLSIVLLLLGHRIPRILTNASEVVQYLKESASFRTLRQNIT